MKKIIAIILITVFLAAAAACTDAVPEQTKPAATNAPTVTDKVTEAPATEAPATEAPATEAPATEAPATEAPATEAPATEAPATEPPATEPPATEPPATEPPATEPPATEPPATEPPVTEEPKTIPENAYYFANIYLVPPDDYTMKDFSGVPSGLKNGVAEGTCFFNFTTITHDSVWSAEEASAFVSGLTPGGCNVKSFTEFEVDGYPAIKIDYEWIAQPIIQSLVRIYFEDVGIDVSIQFAVLTTIPEGVEEFDNMIETLGVVK